MTKKSQARLDRDRVQREAQSQGIKGVYDTLNHLHQQQFNLFTQYRDMIAILANPGVEPFLQNRARVETLVNTLGVDMGDLMDKTANTYRQHQGKVGFAKPDDEDEHFATMQLEQEYIVYMGVHQQILIPILLELDEHMHDALRARTSLAQQAEAAANALDSQPLAQVPTEGVSMIDYGNGAQPVATVQVNGMTVRADGLSHEQAAAATAASYEQPAIDVQ